MTLCQVISQDDESETCLDDTTTAYDVISGKGLCCAMNVKDASLHKEPEAKHADIPYATEFDTRAGTSEKLVLHDSAVAKSRRSGSCWWLRDTFELLKDLAQRKREEAAVRAVQRAEAAAARDQLVEEAAERAENRRAFERSMRESESMQLAKHASACSARSRLQQSLDLYNAKAVPVKADGNCQFRALAQQLHGDESHYASLRARVIEQLKESRAHYCDFVYEAFDDYIVRMSKDCQWGDNVTLQAASDLLGLDIHIITDQIDNPHLVVQPRQSVQGPPQKSLCLTFLTELHYDAAEFLYSNEFKS
jgi:hypothetical protein